MINEIKIEHSEITLQFSFTYFSTKGPKINKGTSRKPKTILYILRKFPSIEANMMLIENKSYY